MEEKNPDWEYFQNLQEILLYGSNSAFIELLDHVKSRDDDTKKYYEWLYNHRFNMGRFWSLENAQVRKIGVDFETNSPKYHIQV